MSTKLLEEILSKENLAKACKAVKANKGTCGVDGMKVSELDKYIEESVNKSSNKSDSEDTDRCPYEECRYPNPTVQKETLAYLP